MFHKQILFYIKGKLLHKVIHCIINMCQFQTKAKSQHRKGKRIHYNKLKIVPLEFSSKVLETLCFLAGGCLDLVLILTPSSASAVTLGGLTGANTKLFPLAPLPTLSSFTLLN